MPPLLVLVARGDTGDGAQTVFTRVITRHATGALVIHEAWQLFVVHMEQHGHDLKKHLLALAQGLLSALDTMGVIHSKTLDDGLRLLPLEPGLGGIKYPHSSGSTATNHLIFINKISLPVKPAKIIFKLRFFQKTINARRV